MPLDFLVKKVVQYIYVRKRVCSTGFFTVQVMLIGYARVSTHEQNLAPQTDALRKAGCHKIFDDKVSGAGNERTGLRAALEYVREGDTLLVWCLDRLGRSLKSVSSRAAQQMSTNSLLLPPLGAYYAASV